MTKDRREVLEAMTDRSPLARPCAPVTPSFCAGHGLEGRADRLGNQQKGLVFSSGACSRMNHDAHEAERLGPIELVDECAVRDCVRKAGTVVARLIR